MQGGYDMGEKIKKPFYKKIWFWVIAVIVVGGVIVNMQDTPKKVGQTNAKVEENKEEAKSKTFKVGDVVELKDLKVTVNKVYTVAGDEFSKPKDGNEYIAADITLENTGKEEKQYLQLQCLKL